jgi:hypothetical protein
MPESIKKPEDISFIKHEHFLDTKYIIWMDKILKTIQYKCNQPHLTMQSLVVPTLICTTAEQQWLVSHTVHHSQSEPYMKVQKKKVLICVIKVDILNQKIQKQWDYCRLEVTNTGSRSRMLPQGDKVMI